jgi:hypothetical protein
MVVIFVLDEKNPQETACSLNGPLNVIEFCHLQEDFRTLNLILIMMTDLPKISAKESLTLKRTTQ